MLDPTADLKATISIWSTGIAILGLGCLFVYLTLIAKQREQHKWDLFAKVHNCDIVERLRGEVDTTVAPIFDSKGGVSYAIGTTDAPDKTAYLCNDGVKYWR